MRPSHADPRVRKAPLVALAASLALTLLASCGGASGSVSLNRGQAKQGESQGLDDKTSVRGKSSDTKKSEGSLNAEGSLGSGNYSDPPEHPNDSDVQDRIAAWPNSVSPDEIRPQNCDMRPGSVCKIQFSGRMSLSSVKKGAVRLETYVDDSRDPEASTELAAVQGSREYFIGFQSFPIPDARTAGFQVFLVDSNGKKLAESKRFDIPITR